MNALLDPAILFFVLGAFAGLVKSNLEIPPAISRFLSLYLLAALGLKGGFALSHSGLTPEVARSLGLAMLLAVTVPTLGYFVLRRLVAPFDAAAIAATYGSVSAVTFVTAMNYLESRGMGPGGHMAAAMALMESPAIIMAVILANALRSRTAAAPAVTVVGPGLAAMAPAPHGFSVPKVLRESFTEGGQLLLLGAMAVGIATGDAGKAAMHPFFGELFRGMLALFLLDMGLLAARNFPAGAARSPALVAYAILGPVAHAMVALLLARAAGLSVGDGAILMVLAASASYIAVPAALRFAIPEANPSLYVGLSLGITFPMNILVGIPVYAAIAGAAL